MEVKLCLKVMINKQKSKVLFAVADNYFTDVLLSFLTLPLGKIVRILEKHYGDKPPVFGSITSLYNGFANLEDTYFSTPGAKQVLLNPAVPLGPQCWKLKLNITESQPLTYFTCSSGRSCPHNIWDNVSMYCGVSTCDCGQVLNKKVAISSVSYNGDDGVLITSKTASFIISDDLRILPNVIGNIQALNRLGVDMDGVELRDVAFGPNEIVELLVECLISPTPLSNLVLNKKKVGLAANPLSHQIKQEENSNSKKKIVVTLCVQKSSNKLLFAQADDDFVELLSSFLIIPLGGVASLLEGNTCHKNIDNLYTSLTNEINDKYLQSSDTKTKLIKPKLSHGYISKNQFLPLEEETAPQLPYYKEGGSKNTGTFSLYKSYASVPIPWLKSPIWKGNYVKESTTYILTDALTVAPFCITSGLAIINQMNIPFSDIDFLDVEVGVEEALSLLKASLTSTSALTDGLMNPKMMKPPKTEN